MSYLARGVHFDKGMMWVDLVDGRSFSFPLVNFPRLLNATAEQLQHYEISGGGMGLHWDELDEDINVEFLFLDFGDQPQANKHGPNRLKADPAQQAKMLNGNEVSQDRDRAQAFCKVVSAILYHHDPIVINSGNNTDEYEMESEIIVSRLNHAKSEADVYRLINETFIRCFEHLTPGSKERHLFHVVAKEIWEAWSTWM